MKPFFANSQPTPFIGVGLRHPHYAQALSNNPINQQVDFVELHAENFFAQGGIAHELLTDVCQHYAVSIHGTSLGLGSNMPVPEDVLNKFKQVVDLTQAKFVSEHLCFNRAHVNGQILHSGDLLPLAYNQSSLNVLSQNISQVQEKLGRPILIENLSAYITPASLDGSQLTSVDSMSEMEFIKTLCKQSGCGLLLDLNNLIVNALNQKQVDVIAHISAEIEHLPASIIGEIHLAGFSHNKVNGFIVDDHANAVSQQCWSLYKTVINLFGHKPTLIEWDNNLPEWHVLVEQAAKARAY